MAGKDPEKTPLNLKFPIWEQVYTVHPLVIIGTMGPDSDPNFAPKHMVFPLGWDNYFGFVCSPGHGTYQNIKNTGEFTVTYPRPEQVVVASLTAVARDEKARKRDLDAIPKIRASEVDGYFIENGYIFLECRVSKLVDGFGDNSLVLSEIVSAHAMSDVIRTPSHDDVEAIYNHPQLAYISPGRFAVIDQTQAFPFPENFKK